MQEIEKIKLRVARSYNKKVIPKSFAISDLVWKTILPIGTKDNRFGKWSPTWDGPYRVIRVTGGNSYMLKTLEGERFPKAFNGKYLKKYHLSIWTGA